MSRLFLGITFPKEWEYLHGAIITYSKAQGRPKAETARELIEEALANHHRGVRDVRKIKRNRLAKKKKFLRAK